MQPHSATPLPFLLRVDSPRPASGGCWAPALGLGSWIPGTPLGESSFFFFLEKIEGLALHFFCSWKRESW